MSRAPELDVTLLRFADLLVFAAHSSAKRQLFREATGVTVPPSGIETLDVLARRRRTAAELADALRIDVAQSSRQVAALVDAGFVRKRRSATDRRQVVIALSRYGETVMHRWQTTWLERYRAPLLEWTTRDVTAFGTWSLCVAERLGTDRAVLAPGDVQFPSPQPGDHAEIDRCLAAVADLVYLFGRADIDGLLDAADVPLRQPEFFALHDIALSGSATVTDMARRLDIGQPAASRTIGQLARDGLVIKERIGGDRRQVRVTVSDEGTTLLRRVRQMRLTEFVEVFDDLPPRARSRYARLTDRYVDDLLRTADSSSRRYG